MIVQTGKQVRSPGRKSHTRWLLGRQVTLLACVLLTGCPPKVVHVPVQAENIISANEAAKEADVAFVRKDYYAALIKYLQAARHNPNSEYIYNKLGITYSQLRYYNDAIEAFHRSIGINSKYAYSYNNLGSVYFAVNDKKKAERSFKKAIGLNPNVASFHINLGTLYFEKKRFAKGREECLKGLALDPAILRKAEGISLVAAGSSTSPSDKSYFMARLFASMGDVEAAVESLKQALNTGFSDIEAIRREPDFDPIRKDERFQTFMKTAALLTRR